MWVYAVMSPWGMDQGVYLLDGAAEGSSGYGGGVGPAPLV